MFSFGLSIWCLGGDLPWVNIYPGWNNNRLYALYLCLWVWLNFFENCACRSSPITLLSWPVWVRAVGAPGVPLGTRWGCSWCCSVVYSPCWTFSLAKQWKMRCGSQAGNHGGFQWKTHCFWWLLESKLCCDLLVLKLLEVFLLSSATMGIYPESHLQLRYHCSCLRFWTSVECFHICM